MNGSKSTEIVICFDESGKQKQDPIQLMGAISIPATVYNHPSHAELHALNEEYKFHWTSYGGYSKDRKGIELLFELLAPLVPYLQINMIRYSKNKLESQAGRFKASYSSKQKILSEMIYTKLPERIFYGLLRGYGEQNKLHAKIFIEDATEYRSNQLDIRVKDTLNIHSLYRGEYFVITKCHYRAKGEEIGVELIDLLLGMISLILDNPIAPGTKRKAKIALVLKLLKQNKLQPFINRIKLFQLDHSNQLSIVPNQQRTI